jgi:integrase/recombinase XerD
MTLELRRPRSARVPAEGQARPPHLEPQDLTWEAALALFVDCWQAEHPGIRPGTLGHYRDQVETRVAAFAKQRGVVRVPDFSRYDLRAFVGWLDQVVTYAGRPLTPRGKQMALDTAKRFLLWLYHEGLLPEDITTHVAKYRLDKDPEPRATPAADLETLLSSLDIGTPTGIRNAAMIQVMAFCGLRVAELVGLNACDLSLTEGRVRVRAETSKGRRTRFVDLPLTILEGREVVKAEVAALLTAWLGVRSTACPSLGEEEALFVTLGSNQWPPRLRATAGTGPEARPPGERMTTDSVRVILKRLAESAGVDPKLATPHRLRHYFGLSSAMAGVPTTALMRAMGHRSPIMTARYSEFADSERRWAFARADITKGLNLPNAR